MSRVSFYTRPYDRLEPYDGKLSRTVLRGGAGSNASLLPDIHSEKDILKLTTTLIANTKGDGKAGDEFWTKAETLLYCALIGYIHYEAPLEEQNFATLIEFLNAMEVREDDETFQNPVDQMFEALKKKKPNHFAVRQYAKFKLAAGVVCFKRLLNQSVRKSLKTYKPTILGKERIANEKKRENHAIV